MLNMCGWPLDQSFELSWTVLMKTSSSAFCLFSHFYLQDLLKPSFLLILFFQTFKWKTKSVILSSFFWGYICLQIFAGQIGKKYGTKWIAFIAMFINATACVVIPPVAEYIGSYGVMACRMIQGLSQGFFFPSVHNILGQWAPSDERSVLGTIAFAGIYC